MDGLHIVVGGIVLSVQLATALAVLSITNKSTGSMASSFSYIFVSFILMMMGTATYIYGPSLFTAEQVGLIGTSYFVLAFVVNAVKVFVIDPKAHESTIRKVSANVEEFFGD